MEWTEPQIEDAWRHWRREVRYRQTYECHVDLWVEPLLKIEPNQHWLKNMRNAAMVTSRVMADKLNMQQSTYLDWERREADGSLSLNDLRRCAAAMNCELVYGLKPKTGEVPSKTIFRVLVENLKWKRCYHLFAQAADLFEKPKFRAALGWPRNRADILPEGQVTPMFKKTTSPQLSDDR